MGWITRVLIAGFFLQFGFIATADAAPFDVDGDGQPDQISYNCQSGVECVLHFGSSRDGSTYVIELPQTADKNNTRIVSTSTDLSDGTVTGNLENGGTITTRTTSFLPLARSGPTMSARFDSVADNDLNGFLNHFCANVQLPNLSGILSSLNRLIGQIMGLINALSDLIFNPGNILQGGGNFGRCIPNINLNIPIPNFSLCLPQIPNLAGMLNQFASCMMNQVSQFSSLIPNIPNVDPNQIEQCIMNQLPGVNLPNLNPGTVLNSLFSLINQMLGILNNLGAQLPQLMDLLGWLKNYCRFFQTNSTGYSGLGLSSFSSGLTPARPNFGMQSKGKGYQVTVNSGGTRSVLANCKPVRKGKKTSFKCR